MEFVKGVRLLELSDEVLSHIVGFLDGIPIGRLVFTGDKVLRERFFHNRIVTHFELELGKRRTAFGFPLLALQFEHLRDLHLSQDSYLSQRSLTLPAAPLPRYMRSIRFGSMFITFSPLEPSIGAKVQLPFGPELEELQASIGPEDLQNLMLHMPTLSKLDLVLDFSLDWSKLRASLPNTLSFLRINAPVDGIPDFEGTVRLPSHLEHLSWNIGNLPFESLPTSLTELNLPRAGWLTHNSDGVDMTEQRLRPFLAQLPDTLRVLSIDFSNLFNVHVPIFAQDTLIKFAKALPRELESLEIGGFSSDEVEEGLLWTDELVPHLPRGLQRLVLLEALQADRVDSLMRSLNLLKEFRMHSSPLNFQTRRVHEPLLGLLPTSLTSLHYPSAASICIVPPSIEARKKQSSTAESVVVSSTSNLKELTLGHLFAHHIKFLPPRLEKLVFYANQMSMMHFDPQNKRIAPFPATLKDCAIHGASYRILLALAPKMDRRDSLEASTVVQDPNTETTSTPTEIPGNTRFSAYPNSLTCLTLKIGQSMEHPEQFMHPWSLHLPRSLVSLDMTVYSLSGDWFSGLPSTSLTSLRVTTVSKGKNQPAAPFNSLEQAPDCLEKVTLRCAGHPTSALFSRKLPASLQVLMAFIPVSISRPLFQNFPSSLGHILCQGTQRTKELLVDWALETYKMSVVVLV